MKPGCHRSYDSVVIKVAGHHPKGFTYAIHKDGDGVECHAVKVTSTGDDTIVRIKAFLPVDENSCVVTIKLKTGESADVVIIQGL